MIVTRLGAGTVKLIGLCATAAALAGLVFGAKSWKDLNTTEKAQVILGGVELFTQITAAIVKRGVAYAAVYDSVSGWEAFKGVFTGKNLDTVGEKLTYGLSGWTTRKNPAIALGHPIGASGARIIVTLLYALQQQQKTLGLAALCHGTGGGTAIAIERV